MAKHNRTYKFRFYPNQEQIKFLEFNFGANRFIWNMLLENFNAITNDPSTIKLTEAKIRKANPWLNDSIKEALKERQIDFEKTLNHFLHDRIGKINFKKKGYHESFKIPGYLFKIDFKRQKIKIGDMKPIKIVLDRTFFGKVQNVTFIKKPTGDYYVSIVVNELIKSLPITRKEIGIDLGLKNLITLSNGVSFSNMNYFREKQSEIKKMQRHLSRKIKGSNRYEKQRMKIAKLHRKIANKRNFILQNLSTYIVKKYDHIYIEDLDIKDMIKKWGMGSSFYTTALRSFIDMLEYKAKWYGRTIRKVGQYFPSSKLCSTCYHKNEFLTIKDREWTCEKCKTKHDRDINAAKNILREGKQKLNRTN